MVNVGTDLFYDAAGNITQYDAISGDDTFRSYDARSNVQMITVGTSAGTTTPTAREQFWYDPNGQRYLGLETWDETEPFFMEIEFEGRTSTIVDEWCEGYARGVKLNPELWLSGGKEVTEPLLAIFAFTEDADWPGHEGSDEEVVERQQAIAPSARAIHAYWQARMKELEMSMEPIRRSEPRVGRNDPCPCGSGKKYKKCCLN